MRELREDTGLAGHFFEYLFHFGGLTKRHHVFRAELPDDVAPWPGNEIERCEWFRLSQVTTLVASVPTRQIVDLAKRHKSVTIDPSAVRTSVEP